MIRRIRGPASTKVLRSRQQPVRWEVVRKGLSGQDKAKEADQVTLCRVDRVRRLDYILRAMAGNVVCTLQK